jgi:hypothetical protein
LAKEFSTQGPKPDQPKSIRNQQIAGSTPAVAEHSFGDLLRKAGLVRNGAMVDSISAALAPITLPDSEGSEVRLGSLWENGQAVVVFLRHYG